MKTQVIILLIALPVIGLAALASARPSQAQSPCLEKVKAKLAARKALHECTSSWAKYERPKHEEPKDDCEDKLRAFVRTCREVRECRVLAGS